MIINRGNSDFSKKMIFYRIVIRFGPGFGVEVFSKRRDTLR